MHARNYASSDNRAVLRPHSARYRFLDAQGQDAGHEDLRVEPRRGGWLATSQLALTSPAAVTCEIEWHLKPDLSTHVLYMTATDRWGDEYTLEAAVTGNGLLASRTGPDGPTQVEMGWGPGVELDHLSAAFTAVMVGRWDVGAMDRREVTSVYIGAEDLLPEPLQQHYRVVDRDPARGVTRLERVSPTTGSSALIGILDGGVVRDYEGLFELTPGWAFI
ncbi:MAG: hypothetical protein NVSMB17_15590 [Candidatus Dormibacteria bacterium]